MLCLFLMLKLFITVEGYTGCDDVIPIDYDNLTATSSLSDHFLPAKAKLDGSEAWCTTDWNRDRERYIQIEFKNMANVVKIVTQGRRGTNQFTTQYKLKFSQDGRTYGSVLSSNGAETVFTGNSNANAKVYGYLPYPVTMKFLRIYITAYHVYPCLRFGVYGCDAFTSNGCESYLIPNVTDEKITAISNYNANLDTTHSRLDSVNAWCPSAAHFSNGYIQVEFSQLTNVNGIATKGRSDVLSYVKSYIVKFSQDGNSWLSVIRDDGAEKVIRGNWDQNTTMISKFDHMVPVKYLRIYPKSYYYWPCLRFDVLGCIAPWSLGCSDYLVSGVHSISDDKITASSYLSATYQPSYGRISTTNYWCSANHDKSTAYFQVQFPNKKKVSGFLTKGRHDYNNFLVLYSISYSNDGGNTWQHITRDDGNNRLFFANRDRTSIMLNMLDTPIEAEMIRFNTEVKDSRPCGSFEVIGCNTVQEARLGSYGHFVPMKVDSSLTPYLIWTKNTDISDCVLQCTEDSKCVSFAFNKNDGVCKGFSAQFYRDDNQKPDFSEDMYYIDRALLDQNGYTVNDSSALCYKIFTSAVSHSDAEKQCHDQKTSLLPIRSAAHLQEIQDIIENNESVMSAGIYVGGTLSNTETTWQYHDNSTVPDALWSVSGKNSTDGRCLTVTKDGLSATDCSSLLSFACGL